MKLSHEILRAVEDLGFEEPTPIQAQAIELIMNGRDVLGQSQTGTGKTAAFGIPCIEKIDRNDRALQAVILCPTRELAIQVSEEFRKLLKYYSGVSVLPIYGGQPIDRQIMALKKGVQVIIGTPGRVMDHMERRTLRLDSVKTVILDEADEMLDMGFRDDIELILGKINGERQVIMFSATMPKEILDLTKKYQNDPAYVTVAHKEMTAPNIEQAYFEVKEHTKLEAMCRLIDMYAPDLSLVFCNTKKRVDEVVEQLQGRGYFAEGLHGDLKQMQRDFVMKKFRNRTIEILVATDVAARGIDVEQIDIVFNYDLPQDEEYYVHRIGRTARAGKSGVAYTFVVGREIYKLRDIMRYTNSKIVNKKLPTLNDIEELRISGFVDEVKQVIADNKLARYIHIVEEMISEDYSTVDIAAALFKMSLQDDSYENIDFEADLFKERRNFENSGKNGKPPVKTKEGMDRLFLNIGKKDKVTVRDIVGAITGESGISGKLIGNVDIYDEFSFVDIPQELTKKVISMVKNKKLKGKKMNMEKAKKK